MKIINEHYIFLLIKKEKKDYCQKKKRIIYKYYKYFF